MSRRANHVRLVARREWTLLRRGRAARGTVVALFAVAWLPLLVLPLRGGNLGIATAIDAIPLALALIGVLVPLLALLAGTDLLAGEMEDGTLIPLLTLPISRTACFAGKLCGRASLLGGAYLAAFGTAALAMAAAHGADGVADYAGVAAAGLLLCLSCTGIGAALAARGRGRVRTYASALLTWLLLVFVIDAVLLAAIVLLAPAPPTAVGGHGHDELTPEGSDPRAPAHGEPASPAADDGGGMSRLAPWILAADPVDLFRLTVLATSPSLDGSSVSAIPLGRMSRTAIAVGWLFWGLLPPALGLVRFRSAVLRGR